VAVVTVVGRGFQTTIFYFGFRGLRLAQTRPQRSGSREKQQINFVSFSVDEDVSIGCFDGNIDHAWPPASNGEQIKTVTGGYWL